MSTESIDRFTHHLRNALSRSIDLAWELRQEVIPPVFLLAGLAEQQGSLGSEVLRSSKVSADTLAQYLQQGAMNVHTSSALDAQGQERQNGPVVFLWPEFSQQTKRMIEQAMLIAVEMHHQYVGTEHLLLALLNQPDEDIRAVLATDDGSLAGVRRQLMTMMKLTQPLAEARQSDPHAHQRTDAVRVRDTAAAVTTPVADEDNTPEHSDTPALDYFGVDLTAPEQLERLDPVIGRAKEIERLVHILSRRSKNNPVLIGDPGVGKTAIVEGLARRIVLKQVPDVLLNKRIIGLNVASVLAGSMYRGEFEARLRQLIDELHAHPEILLFIDELHTLVGAGGVQGGSLDAANILKPALAKGEVRCIGATTADEYRKHIEHDPALERRFQPILVHEPTEDEAVEMLQGLREPLESYHHVTIRDDVIRAAVQLSVRYIPEKFLPDKAIDLIDEAGAAVKVLQNVPAAVKDLQECQQLLTRLRQKKGAAVAAERFAVAVELKKKERLLVDRLSELQRQVKRTAQPPTPLTVVDIARVVAQSRQLPLEHITAATADRFSTIETAVRDAIVGQDDAVSAVLSVLKRSFTGLSAPQRPLGSFLFLGPSGVGKTELAKVIAEALFGDRSALIRLDMSEFSESFTVSKMLGAPAGYVGYNERISLVDQIRRKPYAVVLFDEVEKAHPDIFNVLLQLLDEGRLTDSTGRALDFRHSVIIMTSNVGIQLLTSQAALGFESQIEKRTGEMTFDEIRSTIMDELKSCFPVEFLNRIDHQIVFQPLDREHVEHIVEREFTPIAARLAERGVTVTLSPAARRVVARQAFNPQQGARMVRKVLTDLIENPLADTVLAGGMQPGTHLTVSVHGKQIQFRERVGRPAKRRRS